MDSTGRARKVILLEGEIFCSEELASLEKLAGYGVDVGTQPHRDRSLPPRRAM